VPRRRHGHVGEPEKLGGANELPDRIGQLKPKKKALQGIELRNGIGSEEAHDDDERPKIDQNYQCMMIVCFRVGSLPYTYTVAHLSKRDARNTMGSALEQQWPGSGSRDCEGSNMHNFLSTCPNGASEVFMSIYVKRRCR